MTLPTCAVSSRWVALGWPWLASGRGCRRCAGVSEWLAVFEVGAPSSGPIRGPRSIGPTGRTCLHLLDAVLARRQLASEWHTRREEPRGGGQVGPADPHGAGPCGASGPADVWE